MRKDKIEDLKKPRVLKSILYDYLTIENNQEYKMFKDVIGFLDVNADFDFVVMTSMDEGRNWTSISVNGEDIKKAKGLIKNR